METVSSSKEHKAKAVEVLAEFVKGKRLIQLAFGKPEESIPVILEENFKRERLLFREDSIFAVNYELVEEGRKASLFIVAKAPLENEKEDLVSILNVNPEVVLLLEARGKRQVQAVKEWLSRFDYAVDPAELDPDFFRLVELRVKNSLARTSRVSLKLLK